ncbi:hypothetical protein ACIQI8_27570 [Streptomyces sp. NPDC092369]|uniref:hypothetical protein n=1 Tax=Streptomyces sp. NPDC092369 TaxID=3366015 RepID=UPI00380DE0FE
MARTTTSNTTDRQEADEPAPAAPGTPPAQGADDSATLPSPEPPAETAADSDSTEPAPGVYEYTHSIGCVYPHVPLTCHAHHPAVPATDTTPAIPEQLATVFDWPEGPPADGRWASTRKKPNQAADNAGGLLNGKE